MSETMRMSEAVNEIAGALAKAQGEMSNPTFDAANPHFRNRYASLAAVRNAVIPVLAKHGIAVVQPLSTGEGGVSCETRLIHTSGQWLSAILEIPVSKADAQGVGSAATYARRYQLLAFACVSGDDDDDGDAAAKAPPQERPRDQAQPKRQAKADNGRAADGHKLVPYDELCCAIDTAKTAGEVTGLKLEISAYPKGDEREKLIKRASDRLLNFERIKNGQRPIDPDDDAPDFHVGKPPEAA